ncbi:MAG: Spy/CpxP family protein refolding chaperone [Candidatus Azotimanducaceae bacterium]|jgi:Spy/CpxP family protein refolding chaperone
MANRKNKLINVSLILSLAFNLFLGGILIGNFMFGNAARPFPPHLKWVTESLQDDARRDFRPLMREHAIQTRPLRKALRASQQDFIAAMVSEPFDEAVILKATKALENNSSNLQNNMHEQMIKLMKNMTPEQRKKAINQLKKRRAHRQRP